MFSIKSKLKYLSFYVDLGGKMFLDVRTFTSDIIIQTEQRTKPSEPQKLAPLKITDA